MASSILEQSNAAIDRQERIDAVQELRDRVEDWKGHRVEVFGDLLLHGTYTVLKGENTAKDTEREVSLIFIDLAISSLYCTLFPHVRHFAQY